MKLQTEYGNYDVEAVRGDYGNGNTAITLVDKETGEDVANLTVNLVELLLPDQAYIDTNNFPEAEQFLKETGLGKPTGNTRQSGFCEYPLYNINLDMTKTWEEM